MRLYIILLMITIGINSSCKRIYDPKLDSINSPLFVEGLITDEAKPYTIRIKTATQFNSNQSYSNVTKAKVTVSDNYGHTYKFTETTAGVYTSNPSEFVGVPGRTYTLSILTNDNYVFSSNPQILLPNNYKVTTYAEFGSQDQLVDDGYGTPFKETVQGINLLVDIENNTDTVPHFKFKHKSYREYSYKVEIITDILYYVYYGWDFLSDNDLINITDEQYQTSLKDIKKHAVCFVPTASTVEASYLDSATNQSSTKTAYVPKQIVKVSQYRINNETYQFFKDANTLLAANGKMFDPIVFQLKGNIQCTSNSQKQALGFFEASSLTTNYYAIPPEQKVVSKIKSFEPPASSGCIGTIESKDPVIVSIPPDFWIY